MKSNGPVRRLDNYDTQVSKYLRLILYMMLCSLHASDRTSLHAPKLAPDCT